MLKQNESEIPDSTFFIKINPMKNYLLAYVTFYLVMTFQTISGQNVKQLNGIVVDNSNNNTIEYVSIGLIGKDIGTISNEKGSFQLLIPESVLNDTLTFSKIGFYLKTYLIKDLISQKNLIVTLQPKTIELKEVLVTGKSIKEKRAGSVTKAKGMVMAMNSTDIGGEVGLVIKLPKEPVQIRSFNFYITTNHPDSAKFRLNIYSFNKTIGDNILTENIYFSIPGKYTGDFKLNLNKYHLYFSNDIFVSVEPIVIYTKGPNPNKPDDKFYDRINISMILSEPGAYIRIISLGKWEKLKFKRFSFSPGFWITY
jgi:hypothetical protein